ncbi:MAG: hypothetical protein SGJ23_17505 [Alphaproteobacteria bacterium]|nr:hypothetical protein [Alphaproteobacteria bacterium]
MLRLLFPPVIDNRFRGQWLGLWLLAPVLLLKLAIAVVSIVMPAKASGADAIDVSTYSAAALREAATSMALLGLLHLCIVAIGVMAMVRYRAMVPLMFLWLLAEFFGRRVVLTLYPIDRVEGASGVSPINIVLLSLMGLGLVLSLWRRRTAPD